MFDVRRVIAIIAAALFVLASPSDAQQIPSGHAIGNGTAATRSPTDTSIPNLLKYGLCQTTDAVPYYTGGAWGCLGLLGTAHSWSALQTFSNGATVQGSFTATGLVTNADLVNPSTTVNGQTCTLGLSCTIVASATSITPGSTTITSGTNKGLLYDNAGVLGNLATGNNGVAVTDGSGNPSISSTLPSALTIPSPTLSGTVAGNVTHSGNNTYSGTSQFTSPVTVASTSFGLSGNISAAAWLTSGVRYKNVAGTLTDTTSSGTVAAAYTDVFGGNTIAASSVTTYTNYFSSYFKDPVAGANVTLTNPWAVGGDSARFGVTGSFSVTDAGNATANAALTVAADWYLSSANTPSTLSGDVNNYNPPNLATTNFLRINGGAADRNITGLTAGATGRIIALINAGTTNNLILKNQSGLSSAANRFSFGGDVTLAPNQAVTLLYDATLSNWVAIGSFTTLGGTPTGTVTNVSCFGTSITTSGTCISKGYQEQFLNSNGATFTTPAGTTTNTVYQYEFVGGGGGGGAVGASNTGAAGGGGGSGLYCSGTFTGLAAGVVITFTQGAGGTGPAASNTAGGTGGNSSISGSGLTTVTCNGGGGGGAGNNVGVAGAGGSVGSLGAGSPTRIAGGKGKVGMAGTSDAFATGGTGGSNPLGQGGVVAAQTGNGQVGGGCGAGGSGGSGTLSGGGAGTAGCLYFRWVQ